MAATFIQTLIERYQAVASGAGLPDVWSGIQPEGTARNLPNAVLLHLGERPVYDSVEIAYTDGRAQFCFYSGSLEEAESLAAALQAGMEASPVLIGDKAGIRLEREVYSVNPVQRGPNAQFVFLAAVTYKAMF